jgi:hypothetical protein
MTRKVLSSSSRADRRGIGIWPATRFACSVSDTHSDGNSSEVIPPAMQRSAWRITHEWPTIRCESGVYSRSQIRGPEGSTRLMEKKFYATILSSSCTCSRDRDGGVGGISPARRKRRSL